MVMAKQNHWHVDAQRTQYTHDLYDAIVEFKLRENAEMGWNYGEKKENLRIEYEYRVVEHFELQTLKELKS